MLFHDNVGGNFADGDGAGVAACAVVVTVTVTVAVAVAVAAFVVPSCPFHAMCMYTYMYYGGSFSFVAVCKNHPS